MIGASPLHEIVRRLGGDIYSGGAAALVPGPGHSSKDRSLSLRLIGERVVFHSFADHSPREIFEHLGIEGSKPETSKERREAARQREAEGRARKIRAHRFCQTVWTCCQPLEGSPAATYLRDVRGLAGDLCDVRFHPSAPRSYDGRTACSAMVGLVRDPSGRPAGLHMTALLPDGSCKAFGERSRVMFGAVAGGAVRLAQQMASELAVAEGIETAASFTQLHGVPTWAALSTSGLKRFVPPPGLRKLIIAADPDPSGMEAARELAGRASARCTVLIVAPEAGDWNDALQEARP